MFKDKNTVIGFTLLALLMFAYFTVTTKQANEAKAKKEIAQQKDDSTRLANLPKITPEQVKAQQADSLANETNKVVSAAGGFKTLIQGTEQLTKVPNGVATFTFTNKGGRVKNVQLTNYKNYNNQQVQLLGDSADAFGYNLSTGVNTMQLYFKQVSNTTNADGSTSIAYQAGDSAGKTITHLYTIQPNSYVVNLTIQLQGAAQLVTGNTLSLSQAVMVQQQDADKSYESQNSKFAYLNGGTYDMYDATYTRNFDIEKPIKWFGYKQRFFSSLIVSPTDMQGAKVAIVNQPDTCHKMFLATTSINVPLQANGTASLQLFTGPNDYKILSNLGTGTKEIMQLHSTPFGFVKWINRGVVMPVFDWLLKHSGSVGLAIALLTLVIRILTAPLMFPGYRNSAKMKILRPDLDKLKAKFKDDQQGFAVEQMKFLKQAGVNQLAGCLPGLLQIPIFFALFALFTAHIGVRGESFLWANDLSVFDDVIKFGFNIPALGNHLSLFAITASVTSFFISLYSMSMTPDQDNPVLKYMPYFFPVIMLFIFNKLPSALTWYYTVSNIFTLVIQFVIQKYLINGEKLKAQIELNKKTVKPKSKFQERYEQMMEAQKAKQK